MRRTLGDRNLPVAGKPLGDWWIREVRRDDAEALASLMHEAYRGTIDDDGETLDDAGEEIRKTFAGEYGEPLDACSFVAAWPDGRLASASLITVWEGVPLVAFTMTHPEAKGKGLAGALLARSLDTLSRLGYREVSLVVTEGNEPATGLYEWLGFVRTGPVTPP